MERISIRYLLTPRYILEMTLISSLWAIVVSTPIAIVILVVGFASADATDGPDLGLIIPGVGLLVLMGLVVPLANLWRLRTTFGQPVDVGFSDEGMRQDMNGRHFQGDWSVIASVTKRGPYLLVKTRGGGTIGLPIAAFGSPAAAEALQAMIRTQMQASRALPST